MVQDVYEQMPYNKIWYFPSPGASRSTQHLEAALEPSQRLQVFVWASDRISVPSPF
ncbi:hypothetical protein L917_16384 [Phytophthora nicotianae]|uniref:Uncharacterized protein n=1 Tax=Phytophthora nicotianae TaxID=4792 RepID=W2G1X3_PHYNI|nr:hypothetical protein L915_16657 [Phytophthora nicotianae]ETL83705.1 hypothetical protein L917_16384 [Phytophthora nicotianae]